MSRDTSVPATREHAMNDILDRPRLMHPSALLRLVFAIAIAIAAHLVTHGARAATPVPMNVQGRNVIEGTMIEQYGNRFNQTHRCWIHVDREQGAYCVKAIKGDLMQAHDGLRLYVLADGVPIDDRGSLDAASHASAGLVGAFVLIRDEASRKWRVIAARKDMFFGSSGHSGASRAQLVDIGPSDYLGWRFEHGGMWQGIVVLQQVFLAPLGKSVANLSRLPVMREDDQQHGYSYRFDTSKTDQRVFPVIVEKRRMQDGRPGQVLRTAVVPFDHKNWIYALPPGL